VDGSELEVAVHRRRALGYVRSLHASFPSHKSRQWSIADVDSVHRGLLKNGFKPGSSLSRAKAGNCTTDCNSPDTLSLSFSAVSQIRLT
jgi:hypothetical protein